MGNPLVSFVCPTYGRAPSHMCWLEEVVYWFTRQEYCAKELLICNDAPGQTLVCDTPGVRIINLPERIATLGMKSNYLVSQARGSVIFPQDDDDISLPNRIPQSLAHLQGMYEYWNPKGAYFQSGANAWLTLCSVHSVHHNTSAYKRSMWERGIRYDDTLSGPQDAAFDSLARRGAKVNLETLQNARQYMYVYRWCHGGQTQPNLSGHGNPKLAFDNWPKPTPGTFEIRPKMHRDYYAESKRW